MQDKHSDLSPDNLIEAPTELLMRSEQYREFGKKAEYTIIVDDQALKLICEAAELSSVVALDTEFVRTRTYYANLGLIQLYDGKHLSLIDPTMIKDFTPFKQLLANKNVVKVLHACSEDLEIFKHYFQQLPEPLMDTQIIADFVGVESNSGFAKLINHYFDLELDKGASRTDWMARPLSDIQLKYAAADVWYLIPLFDMMIKMLRQGTWELAVHEECERLASKYRRELDVDNAYLNIKQAWRLEGSDLLCLKQLATWRLQQALRRNLPLSFVMKDDQLINLIRAHPQYMGDLQHLGLHPNMIRIHGAFLLSTIKECSQAHSSAYPMIIEPISKSKGYNDTMKLLKKRLEEVCPEDINQQTIASRRLLNQLLKWHRAQNTTKTPTILKGWRKVYGEQLVLLLDKE